MFNNSQLFNIDMEKGLLRQMLLKMYEEKVQGETIMTIDHKNETLFKSIKLLLKTLLKPSLKILKQLCIRK